MDAPTKGSLWFMVRATARLDSGISGDECSDSVLNPLVSTLNWPKTWETFEPAVESRRAHEYTCRGAPCPRWAISHVNIAVLSTVEGPTERGTHVLARARVL